MSVEGDSYQHQNWDQTATEGYEYTNEWEEYWQWYGYEQQEEAPRGDQEDEWQGYYDDEGNWIDTSIAMLPYPLSVIVDRIVYFFLLFLKYDDNLCKISCC